MHLKAVLTVHTRDLERWVIRQKGLVTSCVALDESNGNRFRDTGLSTSANVARDGNSLEANVFMVNKEAPGKPPSVVRDMARSDSTLRGAPGTTLPRAANRGRCWPPVCGAALRRLNSCIPNALSTGSTVRGEYQRLGAPAC